MADMTPEAILQRLRDAGLVSEYQPTREEIDIAARKLADAIDERVYRAVIEGRDPWAKDEP